MNVYILLTYVKIVRRSLKVGLTVNNFSTSLMSLEWVMGGIIRWECRVCIIQLEEQLMTREWSCLGDGPRWEGWWDIHYFPPQPPTTGE